MGKSIVKRAKSFEVFLKYAAANAEGVRLRETSKLDESVDQKGKKTLTPHTHMHASAFLPKHNVILVYDEHYINRGLGYENAEGEILKPHDVKIRRVRMRAAMEEKGLEVEDVREQ